MSRLLFVVSFIFIFTQLEGQRYLQIEKKNSPQNIKFTTTDVISVRLYNDKRWFSGVIYDFNFEQRAIEFENRIIFLEDIEYIRKGKSGYGNNLMRNFSASMMGFGAGWAIFSLGDAAVTERSFTEVDAAIAFGSMGMGYLLTKFFSLRKYKIGKRWNFRLLNLDIIPTQKEQLPVP